MIMKKGSLRVSEAELNQMLEKGLLHCLDLNGYLFFRPKEFQALLTLNIVVKNRNGLYRTLAEHLPILERNSIEIIPKVKKELFALTYDREEKRALSHATFYSEEEALNYARKRYYKNPKVTVVDTWYE